MITSTFLNQMRVAFGHACLVSKNCFGSRIGMCVFVSVRLCVRPEAINNQWCDIGRVRLVKQASQLFPAPNYLI